LEPARQAWWKAQAERAAGSNENIWRPYSAQSLSDGIRQLDRFGAAKDSGLFAAFLNHPASSFNFYTDGSCTRFFTAREAAKAALRNRHIPLVTDVVTEIKFAPPEKSKAATNAENASDWHITAGLYGLLTTACLIVGFRLWRSRATRPS